MQAGQHIVIASNSWSSQEAEELTIETVSGGNQITLKEPLQYDHSSHMLPNLSANALSAEIALLERSITITSTAGSLGNRQGAFVLIKGNASASLQNIACTICGRVTFSLRSSIYYLRRIRFCILILEYHI